MYHIIANGQGTSGMQVVHRAIKRGQSIGAIPNLCAVAEDTDRIPSAPFSVRIDLARTSEGQVLAYPAIIQDPEGFRHLLGRTNPSLLAPLEDPSRGLNRQPRNALVAVRAAADRWSQAMQDQLHLVRGAEDVMPILYGTAASTTFRGGFLSRSMDLHDLLRDNQIPAGDMRAVIFTSEGVTLEDDARRMLLTQFTLAHELDTIASGGSFDRPHRAASRRVWAQGLPVAYCYFVSGRKPAINAESYQAVMDSEGDALFYECAIPAWHNALETERRLLSTYIGKRDGWSKIGLASTKGFGAIDPFDKQLRYFSRCTLIALALQEAVGTDTLPVTPQPSKLPDRLADLVNGSIQRILQRLSLNLEKSHWSLWPSQTETALREIDTVRERAPEELKRRGDPLAREEQQEIADQTRLCLKQGILAASKFLGETLSLYTAQGTKFGGRTLAQNKQPLLDELRLLLNALRRKHFLANKKTTRAKILALVEALVADLPREASLDMARTLLSRQMKFLTDLKEQVDAALAVARRTMEWARTSAKAALPSPRELWGNPPSDPSTYDSAVKTFLSEDNMRQMAESVTMGENVEKLKQDLLVEAAKPEFQEVEKRQARWERFEIELPLPLVHCLDLGCHSARTLFDLAGRLVEAKGFLAGLRVDYAQALDQLCPSEEEKRRLFRYLHRVSAHSSLIRQDYRIDARALPLRRFRILLAPSWLTPAQRTLLEETFSDGVKITTYEGRAILAAEEIIGVPLHAFQHFGLTLPQAIADEEDLTPYYTDACTALTSYLPQALPPALGHLPVDHLVGLGLACGALELDAGDTVTLFQNGRGHIVVGEGLDNRTVEAIQRDHRAALLATVRERLTASSDGTFRRIHPQVMARLKSTGQLVTPELIETLGRQHCQGLGVQPPRMGMASSE